jgi:hypothetical protein
MKKNGSQNTTQKKPKAIGRQELNKNPTFDSDIGTFGITRGGKKDGIMTSTNGKA